MRTAALTLICFVAFGYAMNAQRFSLLPQVGFENTTTKISYNTLPSFSPAGVKFTPQASLRLNYASKPGHGFFLGAATSRSSVLFSFADPENGMSNFKTASANMQLQLEGGYQFNSKPISLNRSKSSASKNKSKTNCGSSTTKSSCQRSFSSCGSRSSNQSKQSTATKESWVRIQPSVGMGFIPVTRTDVVSKTQNSQTTYEYRAGNWQTGLIAGTSFEFGNNKTRLVTVSVNYFKGLGNLNSTTLTTSDGVKSLTTNLKSAVSGWNMRVGIPFSLQKNKSAVKSKKETKPAERKSSCQQYRSIIRYRCGN